MANKSTEKANQTYVVVLRCTESLIRIPAERSILIQPMQSPFGDYQLRFRQRTEEVPEISASIPRELWIEVRGPAPSMEIAINIAVASANDYVRQLAFGSNAWQGLVGVHLAYEDSAGLSERKFFQNWIVDERGLPRVAREIDTSLMFRLLAAIAKTPAKNRARLLRAITQYTDSLQHWKPSNELYALSHLYMGVEAIIPLVIQREIARRGLKNRNELEMALNGPPPDSLGLRITTWLYKKAGGYKASALEPWARRELIFRGDRTTYRAAQRASNQLEHGLANHDEIHTLAVQAVVKTADYLRQTILELLPIDANDKEQLNSEKYAKPISAGGYDRQLLGRIKSDSTELAATGQLHPYIRWEMNLLSFRRNESGANEMRINQKIHPFFSQGSSLIIERIRFAGPTPTSHTNIEFDITRGDQPREEVVTKSGAQLAIDPPGGTEWANVIGSFMLNTNSLPHLARFWLTKLSSGTHDELKGLNFQESVGRINHIIESDPRTHELREDCSNLWKEAVNADELRSMLSVAYTGENGLVVPLMPPDGRASEITDLNKLRELNDHAVQLVKDLATLLDRLTELRV